MNALEPDWEVFSVLSNCLQVVTESTQISGGLLDHVFIWKEIL